MSFALYEAGGEDETFVLIDTSHSYGEIDRLLAQRKYQQMEHGSLIEEQRIVPYDDAEPPPHTSLDELHSLISENSEMFP